MFVKTSTIRRGNKVYEYLSLVEAVRDRARTRHRTVVRLGEASVLRDTGQLERIVAALSRHVAGDWVHSDDLEATDARSLGAVAAVAAYWGRLGLGAHFGADADAVFAMVANRLCDPCSKRRVPEWVADDVAAPEGFSYPPLHCYYRAVDTVAEYQGGYRDPSLRPPLRPGQPRSAPGLLRPDVDLLRGRDPTVGALGLPGLRLLP
ncbi:MAG: hypothetical protein ACRD0Q_01555 [Acidimicrobiales bacterium]